MESRWFSTLWEQGTPPLQWGLVVLASLVAAALDLHRRRIPNLLTFPLWAGGLFWATIRCGAPGLIDAFLASVLVSLPYIWLFAVAGGGAGDAKMMAALGAWLGLIGGVVLLAAVSMVALAAGAVLSIHRGELGALGAKLTAAGRHLLLSPREFLSGQAPLPKASPDARTMPYGVVIFLGAILGSASVLAWSWR